MPTTDEGGAGAPSTVAAVSTSTTSIRLEWAPVPDADRYTVERSNEQVTWTGVGTNTGDDTSYIDDSVSAGTTYYYRVVAFVEGESLPSDAVSATTPADLSTPPRFISVSASATSVDLAWTDVDGEVGYRIERSPDGTSAWVRIGTTGQDITSFTDAGLTPTTTYSYRVIAVGADGESPPSAVYTIATVAEGSHEATDGPSNDGSEHASSHSQHSSHAP
jgi:titin